MQKISKFLKSIGWYFKVLCISMTSVMWIFINVATLCYYFEDNDSISLVGIMLFIVGIISMATGCYYVMKFGMHNKKSEEK